MELHDLYNKLNNEKTTTIEEKKHVHRNCCRNHRLKIEKREKKTVENEETAR